MSAYETAKANNLITKSPFQPIDEALKSKTVTQYVLERAAVHPADKVALVCGDTGREITYGQLPGLIRKCAKGLQAKGLGKGDAICIYAPNHIDYGTVWHGAASIGAVVTTANPLYTAQELSHQLTDSKAKFLVTIPPFLAKAKEAASLLGDGTQVTEYFVFGEAEGASPFTSLLENDGEPEPVEIDVHDVIALPYSSGTTGLPKGVMLTHYNLVCNIEQCAIVESTVTPDDAYIGCLPLFHIYAMVVVLNLALLQGVKTIIMSRFDLVKYLEHIQTHKVTYLHIVPPIVLGLAKHPIVANYDLSSLKVIFCGAAPLSKELEQAVAQRIPGLIVKQAYGMTETSPAIFISRTDAARAGSCGQLVSDMEAMVLSTETGQPLPIGEDGEICVKGPNVMKGYINRPDATAATVDADGFIHTGDVGHIDADGYCFIVDRVKELIKYKGFQVPPAELEALLLTHEGIMDAAVVGKKDDEAGELPVAFVVLKPNVELTAEQIVAWEGERVAPHKKLRGGVILTDKIPKSGSGKILRRELRLLL